MAERCVGFSYLSLNDPNLGHKAEITLWMLQDEGINPVIYGGIDNLIAVWQSNVTVDHLSVFFGRYTPTQEDNGRLIQPIMEHLISNRTQLRKLSLRGTPVQAQHELILQFMEAATQNPLIEELHLRDFSIDFPVSHFAQFFRMNRNIKKLDFWNISIVAGVDTATNVAAIALNNNNANALQMLSIDSFIRFTEEAARKFLQIMLHPSNQNLYQLGFGGIQFDNDSLVAPLFFGTLLGKSTIKNLTLHERCCPNHFEIIVKEATANIEALSASICQHATNVLTLARALPKMKHLSELNLIFPGNNNRVLSENVRHSFVRSVEQHTNLKTVTLQGPRDHFTQAESRKLRACGDRNVLLRELLSSAGKENQPAPPQVPCFLTTCNNCPAAALALLVALKDKVGPPESQKRSRNEAEENRMD